MTEQSEGQSAIEKGYSHPDAKACPSAPCSEDTLLVGVVAETGRLAYVQPPTRVDAEFIAKARARGPPRESVSLFLSLR